LEQLINKAIYALVKEINSQGTLAYQEKIEEENSILQKEKERETEVINNLITNLILEGKLSKIPKKN